MICAWQNAVDAFPEGPFVTDLSRAVSNDGTHEGGARWSLTQAVNWIGEGTSPIDAYDSIIGTVEALNRVWPVVRMTADALGVAPENDPLPALARFIFERIPAVVKEAVNGNRVTDAPITKAVVIADRADTLVGLFAVGCAPNGSKDPYALRRAAKHFLWCIMPWAPSGRIKMELAA